MIDRGHRKLPVWKASIEMVEAFYAATSVFPREQHFGFLSLVLRAAVSVAANIAEGSARKSTPELLQFLYVANGSLSELDTHLEIAVRLGYLDSKEPLQEKLDSVQGQLMAVIQSLKRRSR
jgi:four helix bundle protein